MSDAKLAPSHVRWKSHLRNDSGFAAFASPLSHLRAPGNAPASPPSHLRISHLRAPGNASASPLWHLRVSGARPRLLVSACSSIPLGDRSDTYDPALMHSLVSLLDYLCCIVISLLLAVLCCYVPHACFCFAMCLRCMHVRHVNVESRTPGPLQTFA